MNSRSSVKLWQMESACTKNANSCRIPDSGRIPPHIKRGIRPESGIRQLLAFFVQADSICHNLTLLLEFIYGAQIAVTSATRWPQTLPQHAATWAKKNST